MKRDAPFIAAESWDVVVYFGDMTKSCGNMPRLFTYPERERRMARVVAWLRRRRADVCWIELAETFPQLDVPRERIQYPVLYSKLDVIAADKEEWTWRK